MTDDKLLARTLYEARLFSGLERADLDRIKSIAQAHTAAAGRPIFMLGEKATDLFIIASGRVGLQLPVAIRGKGADVTLEDKGPGEVIAWSALVPPYKLTLSARALDETTLIGLAGDDLRALFNEHPQIHQRVADNLCAVIGSRVSLLEALFMRDLQRWVVERFG